MEKLVWASAGVTHMAGCSGSPGLHRGTQERGPSPRREAGRPAAEGQAPSDTSRERTENGVGVGVGEGLAQPGLLKTLSWGHGAGSGPWMSPPTSRSSGRFCAGGS